MASFYISWLAWGLSFVLILLGLALARAFYQVQKRRKYYFSGRRAWVLEAAAIEVSEGHTTPAFSALALAALGDVRGVSRSLLARSNDFDEENEELFLCSRILGEAFEGEVEKSYSTCGELMCLSLNAAPDRLERRRVRRQGVIAIAKSVAGEGETADLEVLAQTPTLEPVLYWACRYGVALALYNNGSLAQAQLLVQGAPHWPSESIFQRLQCEIFEGTVDLKNVARAA